MSLKAVADVGRSPESCVGERLVEAMYSAMIRGL
jgi:hypothetical protein